MGDLVNVTVQNNIIRIKIQTLDSETHTQTVNRTFRVYILKMVIQLRHGIINERQRLLFRGRVLQDHLRLLDYQIEEGQTVYLIQIHNIPILPQDALSSMFGSMIRSQIFRVDIGNLGYLVQVESNRTGGPLVQVIPNFMAMYNGFRSQLILRIHAYVYPEYPLGNLHELYRQFPILSDSELFRQLERMLLYDSDRITACIHNITRLMNYINVVPDPSAQRWHHGRVTIVYGRRWECLGWLMIELGHAISIASRAETDDDDASIQEEEEDDDDHQHTSPPPTTDEDVATSPIVQENVDIDPTTSNQEDQLSSAQPTKDEEPSNSD